MFGGKKQVDYAQIERQRLAEQDEAKKKAESEAMLSEMDRLRTLRGRASTMLSSNQSGAKTLLG